MVCASRGGVGALYPGTEYVDIGRVPLFRDSIASGYFAVRSDESLPHGAEENITYDLELRNALRTAIEQTLRDRQRLVGRLRAARLRYVFSSERTQIGSCRFGADRILFGSSPHEGDIYDRLDLANNVYACVDHDETTRPGIESRLGMSLDEPYVLMQTRMRKIWRRSTAAIDQDPIVEALRRRFRVVLLEFGEIRRADSFSAFDAIGGATRVAVQGFAEQSCLVHHARANIFLTEGDFGSHIYVPPFLGRDVVAVSPRDVYELGTTPIDFWNEDVFRFGGKIRPLAAEDIDTAALSQLVESL